MASLPSIAAWFLFAIFIESSTLSSPSPVSNNKTAFRFGLVHRDSPLSPFFNPNATTSDRLKAAYHRSILRYKAIESAFNGTRPQQGLNTSLLPAGGEYLMNISLGTPPVTVMSLMDTGSSLSWSQCLPCTKCFPQNGPIFDPSKSSSYDKLSCNEQECRELENKPSCPGFHCEYEVQYADLSYSRGTLSSDTLTMVTSDGKPMSFRGFVFGCGHDNQGLYDRASGGLVGLTDSPLSLLNQVASYGVLKMFSHCFVPSWVDSPDHISHLMIGDDDSMPDGFWTKMVVRRIPGFGSPMYWIELQDLSVGDERLHIPWPVLRDGAVIDSGSTYTDLTGFAFFRLKQKLIEVIKLKRVPDVEHMLCYSGTTEDLEDLKVPYITFHFKGLDLPAHPLKTFKEIDVAVICLTIVSAQGITVIGNYVQQDMYVGYDLVDQRLYMAPADCPSLD